MLPMLLMRWCCWCWCCWCWCCWCDDAVDALLLMLLMRWCCWWADTADDNWCADAADVMMLLMRCCLCCWWADAVDSVMLLMRWKGAWAAQLIAGDKSFPARLKWEQWVILSGYLLVEGCWLGGCVNLSDHLLTTQPFMHAGQGGPQRIKSW